MKVLHISPELIKGGAERLLLDICVELTKRADFEVMVVALRKKNAYPFLTEQITWKVVPSKVIPSITGKSISPSESIKYPCIEGEPLEYTLFIEPDN